MHLNMHLKQVIFLALSFLFLLIAFLHEPLYLTFPTFFEPVNQFIQDMGSAIFYLGGFLALTITLFIWLPTWASLLLFFSLMMTSGFYLNYKVVQITLEKSSIFITIKDK